MAETPTEDPPDDSGRFRRDSRSGADRRAWHDRREDDRRSGSHEVETEHRAEPRRSDERRVVLTDRRRGTPERYSRQDAERIRDMIVTAGSGACPQCDGELVIGQDVSGPDPTARLVHCAGCRRSVIIANPPEVKPRSPE